MFVEEYLKADGKIKKLCKSSTTFAAGYNYWLEILFERAMRLFVWDGCEDSKIYAPRREIEKILLMNGTAGFAKWKGKVNVFSGSYSGRPSIYFDEFEDYAVYSPIYSDNLKIGKEVEVMNNNACRNSLYPLCHRYAMMLSHTEVTFVNTLINGRNTGGIPIASTRTQAESIKNFRNSLCNGNVESILDPAFAGVDFKGVNSTQIINVKDLIEVRENLLNSFYQDIGVKTSYNKKGNMIVEEVEANNSMLLLNLHDMLECRKYGCEKVNKLFGTNLSVDISDELKYNEEENENEEGESLQSLQSDVNG